MSISSTHPWSARLRPRAARLGSTGSAGFPACRAFTGFVRAPSPPASPRPAAALRLLSAALAALALLLSAPSSAAALPATSTASFGGAAGSVGLPTALPLAGTQLDAKAQEVLAAEHGTWSSPTGSAPALQRDFDPPAKRWLSGHRGVDLTVPLSGEVRSPEAGRVSHVGRVVDRYTITIDHGDGLRSSFEPVESDLKVGDRVRKGEVIGVLSGGSHCLITVRACVHWGVRLGDDYVHPMPFLGAHRPSVLLPVPREARR